MVYARSTQGRTLTFLVSGKLWRNSLVMEDSQTHSAWSHVLGKAIMGPLEGAQLRVIPSVQTSWKLWLAAHPGTLLLKKEKAITASPYQRYFDDPEKMGLFRARWLVNRLPGKEVVYGLHVGPHATAVTGEAVTARGVVRLKLGETPVLVFRAADGGVRAYRLRAQDAGLALERDGASVAARDGSGRRWSLETGRCLAGPCHEAPLAELPVEVAYWFAWSGFFPNTLVVDGQNPLGR